MSENYTSSRYRNYFEFDVSLVSVAYADLHVLCVITICFSDLHEMSVSQLRKNSPEVSSKGEIISQLLSNVDISWESLIRKQVRAAKIRARNF